MPQRQHVGTFVHWPTLDFILLSQVVFSWPTNYCKMNQDKLNVFLIYLCIYILVFVLKILNFVTIIKTPFYQISK